MFHNVRVAVMDKTNGDQVPWMEDGIQRRERPVFGGRGASTSTEVAPNKTAVLSWKTLTADNFPAKVKVVVLQDGAALTSGNPVQIGQWSVSFGSKAEAYFETKMLSKVLLHSIMVRGLDCSNAIAGLVPCYLQLGWSPTARVGAPWYAMCSLRANDPNYKGPFLDLPDTILDITCPAHVRMQ
jgi:hypothetical protein